MNRRVRATIRGRVQGVGFRPTVYRHAVEAGLTGSVRNAPAGVIVEVEGPTDRIDAFFERLRTAPPPQARIEHVEAAEIPCEQSTAFQIVVSQRSGDPLVGMPPDLATCEDCRRELLDPADRRHRYPFINCTNCGPRFTIVTELPYDRPYTSMAPFEMCPDCLREYTNPLDRRFDAQPNACPVCGPRVRLITPAHADVPGEPISKTIELLRAGRIVAVKGLGGYHLACDALSDDAVRRLRDRKGRPAKALAVMFPSIEAVREHCETDAAAEAELTACSRPIVVLRRRPDSTLSSLVAPDTHDAGAFLPYTPLHVLLLAELSPLVMTSGNLSEEPIVKDEAELDRILGDIADYALVHDRAIVRRCDDSVLRLVEGRRMFLRRSRGFVPAEIRLPFAGPPVLACGGELKNTFCVTRADEALLSQHIGDLSDYTGYRFFCEAVEDMVALLEVKPEIVAHDLHPDYLSTRYARKTGAPRLEAVQHHHAHVAGCMVEHGLGLDDQVIGVSLDGSGYGPDGTVWGGEIMVAGLAGFERVGHFKHYRLPGGEEAIRHPVRMALSCLIAEFGADDLDALLARLPDLPPEEARPLAQMIARGIRSPLTSSAGRLFDAVAALVGLCPEITYEGQAAIRLQTAADEDVTDAYNFDLEPSGGMTIISFGRALREILADLGVGAPVGRVSARFHNAVAAAVAACCEQVRERRRLETVVLTGGVFQNDLLLRRSRSLLRARGFRVCTNERVPPNDGGISLGQAAVALARHELGISS